MWIEKLTLRDFRNYAHLNLSFRPGVNVLSGPNGSGKTNIVEAIFYLVFANSFRTNEDIDLIRDNHPIAYIEGIFQKGKNEQKVQIELQPSGRKIALNGRGLRRLSELNSVGNALVFTPKDVFFFDDAPRLRRRYLDTNISKNANYYLRTLVVGEKALKERNRLLKQKEPDRTHLAIITKKLIEASEIIVNYRAEYLEKIQKSFDYVLGEISSGIPPIKLNYSPFVSLGPKWKERAQKAYDRLLETDLEQRSTSIGYQREDFTAEIDGKEITTSASQGQKRLIAMALKLAPYFLIEDEEKKPIIFLDDGLSELDEKHRDKLLKFLTNLNQTFITVTKYAESAAIHYAIDNRQNVTRKDSI
ncbi:MAG: DNA replication/repair protein RecF [Syntrophomonadaceae bacterium]|jgi:DNA replication and repair protein RecF